MTRFGKFRVVILATGGKRKVLLASNVDFGARKGFVDVKKLQPRFYPPEQVESFEQAVKSWLRVTRKRDRALGLWAQGIVADEDVVGALIEIVCWYNVAPKDLLDFLAEAWIVSVPNRELRAHISTLGKRWKQIETLTRKARKESDPYLGDQRSRAIEIESTARFLSRYFSPPRAKRPLEIEIADCKVSIKAFLRRNNVRKVNNYGWILLKAVFGKRWRAGGGKDQIEAFRQIPRPHMGKIRNRVDAERAIEKAKIDILKMEQAARKR